jgi:hypothetical protein
MSNKNEISLEKIDKHCIITSMDWFNAYYAFGVNITGTNFNQMRKDTIGHTNSGLKRLKFLKKNKCISKHVHEKCIEEHYGIDNNYIDYINNKDIDTYLKQCRKKIRHVH